MAKKITRQIGWDDKNYVKVYELRRGGANSLVAVAGPMGIQPETLQGWLEYDPALLDAWERGGDARGANGKAQMHEYIYARLPPKLQVLWDEINDVENKENPLVRCEAMFAEHGKRARQHIFLFALCYHNHNPSLAMGKVGISKKTLDQWCQEPVFVELMDEMEFHKKNFAEGCLFGLAEAGDSPATIFLNKSLNKDRGYDPKTHVVHEGLVKHEHVMIDVDDLDLPTDVKRIVLEAYRAKLTGPDGDLPRLPGTVVPGGEDYVPPELEALDVDFEVIEDIIEGEEDV